MVRHLAVLHLVTATEGRRRMSVRISESKTSLWIIFFWLPRKQMTHFYSNNGLDIIIVQERLYLSEVLSVILQE